MNSIAKRHNVFPILERYISLTDLDYPSSIQDIVPSLQKVLLLEASSRNAIFWEYKQYVLGKCLFRYDNDHQMTITSFATANMARSFHSHRDTEHSMFLPGVHVLRQPLPGIGTYLFSDISTFCRNQNIHCIRLIPDPTTGSIRFYNKIKDRLSDEFEKVTGPDYQSALFFFLK